MVQKWAEKTSRCAFHIVSLILLVLSFSTQAVADVDQNAINAAKPPKLFSKFGFFTDLVRLTPVAGVFPYSVRNELFSDHALKTRFVYVPSGTTAVYHPTEAFNFPVGTALIKNFAFPADFREPTNNLTNIEIRVLLHQADGWKTFAYVWNKDQQDAVLKIAGKRMDVSFTDLAGNTQTISYKVPNKNQCKGCHFNEDAIVPIGPKARNLNFELATNSNQLQNWVDWGVLADAPEPQIRPSVPDWRDASASLESRARAYLDINCAHCHRSSGPASNSGLFLTYYEQNRASWGYKKRPVAAGSGTGGHEFAVHPGKADQSILVHRMRSLDTGIMMPELGRSTTDSEAVSLISQWINSLN